MITELEVHKNLITIIVIGKIINIHHQVGQGHRVVDPEVAEGVDDGGKFYFNKSSTCIELTKKPGVLKPQAFYIYVFAKILA